MAHVGPQRHGVGKIYAINNTLPSYRSLIVI